MIEHRASIRDSSTERHTFTVEVEKIERVYELAAASRRPRPTGPLGAMCAASPHDPWPHVWFAEAMIRAAQPTEVASAATPSATDAARRAERVAWALALDALDERPDATEHVHVLARIYLARGLGRPAVALAAVGALGASADLALVTLATALRKSGADEHAARAARTAIARGSTLGHRLLADQAMAEYRYGAAVDHLAAVRRADLIRYHGVDPTTPQPVDVLAPLAEIEPPPPIGDVLRRVSAAVPALIRSASNDVVEVVYETLTTVDERMSLLGGDDSAFPNPFAAARW